MSGSGSTRNGSISSSQASRGSSQWCETTLASICPSTRATPARIRSFHLYVDDIEVVSKEFGVPIDEDGLAGRECDFEDPDGNRLRVATRRS